MSEKDNHTPDIEIGTAAEMEEVMRKYDRESATRIWEGKPKQVVRCVMAMFSLYCIWSTLFSTADLPIRLTAFLGLITVMGYLTYPARKNHVRPNSMPWYDIILMLLGAGSFFYYCINYTALVKVITSASKINPGTEGAIDGAWFYVILGVVGILCLAELCRRCVGLPILCVVGVLLVYTFASGQNLGRVIYTLFYGTSGILATPVQVCAKFIAVFIIFGAFLERTGISNFFIDLANSLAGSASGGPAKVAVISSALCGMVSGSSVGNTVTTGSVTIPMMKKTGYKGEFAGAVEAAASTGGQIMPPIMGAAAFLMAEYTGIEYAKIALLAVLPALLYFTGIFIAVHLEAKKLGLRGIPKEELPKFRKLLPKLYLLLPLVILVALVSNGTRTMQSSAAIAILVTVAVGIVNNLVNAVTKNEDKSDNITLMKALDALEAGAKGTITVAAACAMAGLVAGCITTTGLANMLLRAIVSVSGGLTFVALFLTMLCCIVLGMGVPTTANYCIMASTCAPIPVALAAYAGSAIAKSPPMKTAFNATKLAIAAFVVPYIFAMNPAMLFQFDPGLSVTSKVLESILIVVTSLVGLFGIASALNGFLYQKINPLFRILLAAGGLCMMIPGLFSDVVGLAAVAAVVILQRVSARRAA